MHKHKIERTRQLGRFRKLSEDKASIELQSAVKRLNTAREERQRATVKVDAISEWKALADGNSNMRLAMYAHALEFEEAAMSSERHALDKERHFDEQCNSKADRYSETMAATRVVQRRLKRMVSESAAHQERVESDAVSDLWLARSVQTDA